MYVAIDFYLNYRLIPIQMNLRHNKPTHSYSEESLIPKVKEYKHKQDPLLKQNAKLLIDFISGVNLKFNAFKKLSKKQRTAFKQKS